MPDAKTLERYARSPAALLLIIVTGIALASLALRAIFGDSATMSNVLAGGDMAIYAILLGFTAIVAMVSVYISFSF